MHKEFSYENYHETGSDVKIVDNIKIKFIWNNRTFFSGSMEVYQNYHLVYKADSFYSSCDTMILADLNGDGSKEFLFLLSTGALMYDYNMCVIFDRTKDVKPLFEVHNAYVVYEGNKPLIEANIRLSPNVLGLGFVWQLEYKNGRLVYRKPRSSSFPDEKDFLDNLKQYKEAVNPCEDGSSYMVFFEAYAVQSKIAGSENKGWDFFDKNYNCKDKTTRLGELKRTVKEYWKIIAEDGYTFNGNER